MSSRKRYLVNFTFRSGEFEQPFCHVFEATTTKTLERKIHDYLKSYSLYPEREGNVYYYHGGEVAVKYEGLEEIISFEQLLDRLKVHE